MWELRDPRPVKLIIGTLATDQECLCASIKAVEETFGKNDLVSEVWPFDKTDYYKDQTGPSILRQFVSIDKLVSPVVLADVKLHANELEQELAKILSRPLPRPVNLDPGIIEPSKLILATTKNYSHRIYIGKKIYAEVTLLFDKGSWRPFEYTYPDYRQQCYFDFFAKVRSRLVEQLHEQTNY